ncbi:hypothetical protein AK830_g6748 [Neonectria ditissima]|uniref:O-methyltransferase domain-containing protein n=1 Tax=Neonectria ditissima TaxID=78410 RepID=A0A0P7BHC0_9HYPO|nr:hypothetical protein AK830_g6748 [Neonectria ditissima]
MTSSEILERMQAASVALENNETGAREALLDLNRQLLAELETPTEFLQRLYFATASLSGILEIAARKNVFRFLEEARDGVSTEALSEMTGIETPLLGRFMRYFAAHKVVRFSKSNGWHATDLSNVLSTDRYRQSILFCHGAASRSFRNFPEHFDKAGYKAPGLTDGPYQSCFNSSLPFFDWLAANPPFVDWFASFMSVYRAGNLDWWTFYPVAERLVDGFNKDSGDAFLVDVGGGRGHDLGAFAGAHPTPPGRLILQDQPEVIATVQQDARFESQSHDFYTPQPIKYARAYVLHSILHDWSDENGVKILQNLKPALKPGYSRVLLNEIVLSEEGPSVPATAMDMMMLGHLGASRERTGEEWQGIVTKAGLRIVNVVFEEKQQREDEKAHAEADLIFTNLNAVTVNGGESERTRAMSEQLLVDAINDTFSSKGVGQSSICATTRMTNKGDVTRSGAVEDAAILASWHTMMSSLANKGRVHLHQRPNLSRKMDYTTENITAADKIGRIVGRRVKNGVSTAVRHWKLILFCYISINLLGSFIFWHTISNAVDESQRLEPRWGGFNERPMTDKCYGQERTAMILSLLFGFLGVDQFYAQHWALAAFKLVTLGGMGTWALVDHFLWIVGGVYGTPGCPGGSGGWQY